jgi:hypothetical protein
MFGNSRAKGASIKQYEIEEDIGIRDIQQMTTCAINSATPAEAVIAVAPCQVLHPYQTSGASAALYLQRRIPGCRQVLGAHRDTYRTITGFVERIATRIVIENTVKGYISMPEKLLDESLG